MAVQRELRACRWDCPLFCVLEVDSNYMWYRYVTVMLLLLSYWLSVHSMKV